MALDRRDDPPSIELDLDRDRIRTVLSETYRIAGDYLQTEFLISKEEFVSKIDVYLQTNRISIPVTLDLPGIKCSGLKIEVNLRRKKVFARLFPKSRQAMLNHLLKAL